MRKPTLTHVSLNTVEQCRSAATQVVKAYRLGGHRVIGQVKTGNQRVKALTALAAKGVDQVADRSEQLIAIGAKTTSAQISRASKFAGRIEHPVLATGLQTASRLSLPSALAVLAVAGKAAAGAESLVKAVEPKRAARKARPARAARPAPKAAAKPARKPVARKAVAPVAVKAKPVRAAAPKKAAIAAAPAATAA